MEKIADIVRSIASGPALRTRNMTGRGLEPVSGSPDAFASFLKQDRVTAKKAVGAAGLKPQ